MELPSNDDSDFVSRVAAALEPEVQDEPVEAQADTELPAETPETDEGEAPQQEEETADLVEITAASGKTYRVPQELRNEFMHQADYTRKTQEISALQRSAQASLIQQAMAQRFQEQTRDDTQKLAQLHGEMKRLKQLDWTALDFETQFKTRAYLDNLKDEIAETEKAVEVKRGQFGQQAAQARAEAARSAYEFIGRHAKDWTPDSATEQQVARYAGSLGVPPETLAEVAVLFPGFAVMAHKAAQFDRLQSTKGQAVQKAQKAPPVIKPGAVANGNTLNAVRDKSIRSELKKTGDPRMAQRWLMERMK